MRRAVLWLVAAAAITGPLVSPGVAAPTPAGRDATVVAVIDTGFSPYHWDFLAARMPQHRDRDRGNDLPLTRPPHEWLSGFPRPGSFESYERFPITLPTARGQFVTEIRTEDEERWESFPKSDADTVNYRWIPGTKFIGVLDFGDGSRSPLTGTNGHGVGTTSVSVGNLHGTCPECLVLFLRFDLGGAEAALQWALAQPWIDVVSNSYGNGVGKVYDGPSRLPQRDASLRGQTVVFSSGNGVENTFTVPNHAYLSSEKGPDWLVTVGAVAPGTKGSYVGAGKPVDVAGAGGDYPSAYWAATVDGTGTTGFAGTSNAAPTVAGLYARALHLARRHLVGPSRTQRNGVIAVGAPFRCGARRRDCELRDGKLTAAELRIRLFHAAVHTSSGMTTVADGAAAPPVGEDEYLNEGHGTFLARLAGDAAWLQELDRIMAPLEGRAEPRTRPAGEREWMIVDSYCKQQRFGHWSGGYYVAGTTPLPSPEPGTPVRNAMAAGCERLPAADD